MLIWYSATLLAIEAGSVVTSRITQMANGSMTPAESNLMVAEKVSAAFEAFSILASGGDTSKVIDCYRKHVAANVERLNKINLIYERVLPK